MIITILFIIMMFLQYHWFWHWTLDIKIKSLPHHCCKNPSPPRHLLQFPIVSGVSRNHPWVKPTSWSSSWSQNFNKKTFQILVKLSEVVLDLRYFTFRVHLGVTHQIKDSEEMKTFIRVNEILTDIYLCKVRLILFQGRIFKSHQKSSEIPKGLVRSHF